MSGDKKNVAGPEIKYYWLANRAAASTYAALMYRAGVLTMEQVYSSKYLPSMIAKVDMIGLNREV